MFTLVFSGSAGQYWAGTHSRRICWRGKPGQREPGNKGDDLLGYDGWALKVSDCRLWVRRRGNSEPVTEKYGRLEMPGIYPFKNMIFDCKNLIKVLYLNFIFSSKAIIRSTADAHCENVQAVNLFLLDQGLK